MPVALSGEGVRYHNTLIGKIAGKIGQCRGGGAVLAGYKLRCVSQEGKMGQFLKTVFTLVVLSLVVGLILATLGINPAELPEMAGSAIGQAVRLALHVLDWGWRYIVLGASVVVPAWLLLYLFRYLRR